MEVTLEDAGGLENIVEDLNEVIAFLKNPESFKRLGAKPPKGLLMEGGPGVGKTLIAKAIAGEAEVPFYSMSGAEFVEIIVGVGAARVRDLFKRARLNAPCLIFVDEIDALGTKRAAAGTRGTEEHEQTLNQLLTEMDGFTPDTGVAFIGATNRADLLDPALMRPGRFDRKVTVPQPGIDARAKILQIHLAKRNVDPDIDTLQLAKNLPGLSAELANICNEAAAVAVRRGADRIETSDVMEATDRVTNGLRHPIPNKDNDVVHRMTRHELGHALVATVLYEANGLIEPVERVSIIPRGRDPTQTTYNRKRDEDYLFPTRARLLERVQVLLAGRAGGGGVFRRRHHELRLGGCARRERSGTKRRGELRARPTRSRHHVHVRPGHAVHARAHHRHAKEPRGEYGGDGETRVQPKAARVRQTRGLRSLPVRRA